MRKNKRNKSAHKGIRDRKFINTGYSSGGASLTKQALRGYNPIQSSPQSDIDSNLNILRNRSYDMAINTPIGRGAIETSRSYVIGAGLIPSPNIDFRTLGLNPDEAKEWKRKTIQEFKLVIFIRKITFGTNKI